MFQYDQFGPSVYLLTYVDSAILRYTGCTLAISVLTYLLVFWLIPHVKAFTLKAGLKGKDLGKKGTPFESRDM